MPRMMRAVDEGVGRRVDELELDAAILLQDLDIEIRIALEQRDAHRRSHCPASAPQARSAAATRATRRRRHRATARLHGATTTSRPGSRRDARAERGGFMREYPFGAVLFCPSRAMVTALPLSSILGRWRKA